jgi:hypothetical protein
MATPMVPINMWQVRLRNLLTNTCLLQAPIFLRLPQFHTLSYLSKACFIQ